MCQVNALVLACKPPGQNLLGGWGMTRYASGLQVLDTTVHTADTNVAGLLGRMSLATGDRKMDGYRLDSMTGPLVEKDCPTVPLDSLSKETSPVGISFSNADSLVFQLQCNFRQTSILSPCRYN